MRAVYAIAKAATFAGIVGLAVLNPDPFAKLVRATFQTFGNAVRLGTGGGAS